MSHHQDESIKYHRFKDNKENKICHSSKLKDLIINLNDYFENKKYLDTHDKSIITIIDEIYENQNIINKNEIEKNVEQFFDNEDLVKYITGYQNLVLLSDLIEENRKKLKIEKLPFQAVEIAIKFIELLDLTKLPRLANKVYITELLDNLIIKLENLNSFDMDNIIEEIKIWKGNIKRKRLVDIVLPSNRDILSIAECNQLEEVTSKWLEFFRAKISSLSPNKIII